MSQVRNMLFVFPAVFIFSLAARADMATVNFAGTECRQVARACSEVKDEPTDSAGFLEFPSIPVLGSWDERLLPEVGEHVKRVPETQRPKILTDGQSSVNLYLSALISLGLCSYAHCLKKLHSNFISEWHHSGGPFQIGHSIAVSPDSICPAPVCAFIQPAHAAEDHVPQYRLGAIVSLWRKSQFTVTVLAPRGPPHIS